MVRVVTAVSASLAAMLVQAAAASAQSSMASAFSASRALDGAANVRVHRGQPGDHDGRRHRRDGNLVVTGYPYVDGSWALYNNRSWEPDSYNDWWHDRPDRAFPRWMQMNQRCERSWWSGAGWQC